MPLLVLAGEARLGLVAAAMAVAGTLRGAGDTGTLVLVPRAAEASGTALERASGAYDGVNRVAGLLGVALAGVLIEVAGAATALAFDAGTYLACAVLIRALVPAATAPRTAAASAAQGRGGARAELAGYLGDLGEGFAFLRRDRLLLAIATTVLVTNTLDAAYSVVLVPVWVRDHLGGAAGLGLIGACFGAGAVTGNLALTWLAPRLPRRRAFAWCFLVGGAPRFLVLAAATTLPPVLAVCVLAGVGAGGINPFLGAAEYERVPPRLQARVLGAVEASAWAGLPFGGLVGGGLVSLAGLPVALLICGVVYLGTTLAPFVFPCWRAMDRIPSPVDPEPGRTSPVEQPAALAFREGEGRPVTRP